MVGIEEERGVSSGKGVVGIGEERGVRRQFPKTMLSCNHLVTRAT